MGSRLKKLSKALFLKKSYNIYVEKLNFIKREWYDYKNILIYDCEYVSHITLCEGTQGGLPPTPEKIVIKDNLAVIGAMDGGMIYLVDISNKMEPELIDKLILGEEYQQKSGRTKDGVTDLAIEDNVLFVSIEFKGSDKNIIYSLDISDPEKMNVNDDLLGSYTLNDDYRISTMTSAPGYLYVSMDHGSIDHTLAILIIDIKDPKNLFPVKTLDYVFDISKPEAPLLIRRSEDVEGTGLNLYLIGERLGLHTTRTLKIFDISSPAGDISVAETVDIHKILEDELDGWGVTGDIIPEPPPSLYGGYSPYPLMGGIYGGYGSLMSEPTVHIGEINLEGGLYIGELQVGSALSSQPYASPSFIFPSRGSAFLDFSIPPSLSWYDFYSDK